MNRSIFLQSTINNSQQLIHNITNVQREINNIVKYQNIDKVEVCQCIQKIQQQDFNSNDIELLTVVINDITNDQIVFLMQSLLNYVAAINFQTELEETQISIIQFMNVMLSNQYIIQEYAINTQLQTELHLILKYLTPLSKKYKNSGQFNLAFVQYIIKTTNLLQQTNKTYYDEMINFVHQNYLEQIADAPQNCDALVQLLAYLSNTLLQEHQLLNFYLTHKSYVNYNNYQQYFKIYETCSFIKSFETTENVIQKLFSFTNIQIRENKQLEIIFSQKLLEFINETLKQNMQIFHSNYNNFFINQLLNNQLLQIMIFYTSISKYQTQLLQSFGMIICYVQNGIIHQQGGVKYNDYHQMDFITTANKLSTSKMISGFINLQLRQGRFQNVLEALYLINDFFYCQIFDVNLIISLKSQYQVIMQCNQCSTDSVENDDNNYVQVINLCDQILEKIWTEQMLELREQ